MKIAIAGSGAMGCRFGALLKEADHDVILVDEWAIHIEAINQRGLEIRNETGSRFLPIKACLPPEVTEIMDLVIVFTKAMLTDALMQKCQHFINDRTLVLTLQNGLGNIEILEKSIPRDNLIVGVTTYGTELLGPGIIQAFGSGHNQIMQVDGKVTDDIKKLAEILIFAGMDTKVSENAFTEIWNKVAFNSVLNTLCTLMENTVGAVGHYSMFHEVIDHIVEEIIEVGYAEGVSLNKDDIFKMIINVIPPDMAGNHLPSMYQDMENNRQTEIDFLNGAIVNLAKKHNIAVPMNLLITHLIKMKEEIRFYQSPQEVKK